MNYKTELLKWLGCSYRIFVNGKYDNVRIWALDKQRAKEIFCQINSVNPKWVTAKA